MSFDRSSGVLLHPTSFPGRYGIGDLGPYAHQFVDWLADAGCKLWQVLPLGPTGYGDSPYQCFSAFAGNPYLISPDFLLRDNFLHSNDLADVPDFADDKVDYGRIIPWKLNLLERAFLRFTRTSKSEIDLFTQFCIDNEFWLNDYALFMALKEANGGGAWSGWPVQLRKRDSDAITLAAQHHRVAIERFKFYQFVFFRQWNELHEHAHHRGIQIIGDIPIFVAYDSADVWSSPDLFFLDGSGKPTVVAGVPPDYFSPTGQFWGNPLYRWNILKNNDYEWWIARFRAMLNLVDVVRLDHFRGFAGYWEIPAGSPTAEHGRWVTGPGADFLLAVKNALGDLPIIAEDLGEITPDVIEMRDQFELPGMKILQFAFSGPENEFLPHNFTTNCVAYTGTHDNDTSQGWYDNGPAHELDFARRYLSVDGSDFAWDLIRAAWSSVAVYAITSMQDLLNLGMEARMNYPSRLGGNWEWRMNPSALTSELCTSLGEINYLYRR